MTKAVCRICRKEYINKVNTTNLQWHIDHEHDEKNAGSKVKNTQQRCTNAAFTVLHTTRSKSEQPKITSSMLERISTTRQAALDDALMKLLVGKVLPLSLVEHPLFHGFVNLLDSRYKIPGRHFITKALERKKKNIEEKVKSEMKSCKNVSITHDGWTSCNTESYSCVTAHFITNQWELVNAVLQTKIVEGSHTGENIANALKEVKETWSLPDIISVTDNAANEKKAFQILNWIRFGCYGHRINLVVKNALSVSKEISHVMAKGRKLVTFFHQSTSANDSLLAKQKLLLQEEFVGHKLIMDVPTRWNSTVAMLRRLLEQTPAILALATDSNETLSKTALATVKGYVYTFEDQSLVERLVEILAPFERATAIVCADKSPTMHKILPVIIKIEKCISISEDDPESIKKMKIKMSNEMINRCAKVENDEEISLMACILNPLMKQLDFLTPEQKNSAKMMLTEKALELADVPLSVKTEPTEDNPPPALPSLPSVSDPTDDDIIVQNEKCESGKTPKRPPNKKVKSIFHNEDIDDWLTDVIYVGGSTKTPAEMIQEEIGRYLASEIPEEDIKLSILEWWKRNQYLYPRLSILAKKYLCIPASSVPSERVFSLAGQVVSKKRSRMNASNVDMLIFMNKNMERYWK